MATLDSIMPVDMLNYNFGWLTAPDTYFTEDTPYYLHAVDFSTGYSAAAFGDGFGGFYDAYGNPVFTGTITSYFEGFVDEYGQFQPLLMVDGMSTSLDSVLQSSLTQWASDDQAVMRSIFAGNDSIAGSGYADVLDGFAGNDTIYGYAGDDLMYGEAGNDVVYGDDGNDLVDGGYGDDWISGGYGNDGILGGAGNDSVYGGDGNDLIDGGIGSDVLAGDFGDDRVFGGDGNDAITGGYGYDVLDGGLGNDSIYGGADGDVMKGGYGNDVLSGDYGNDRLGGGAGKDVLRGGAGRDSFVFDTKPSTANIDRIVDFNVRDDTIALDNAVMKVGHNGALAAGYFWKSTTGHAHDRNDHIIYETDTGWLNYDSNGSAAGGEVHLAKLAANLAMTARDFIVF